MISHSHFINTRLVWQTYHGEIGLVANKLRTGTVITTQSLSKVHAYQAELACGAHRERSFV